MAAPVFVTFSGSTTESLYVCESVWLPVEAWILKLKSPVAVGVPESKPLVVFSVRPAGSCPETTDQVTAALLLVVSCKL